MSPARTAIKAVGFALILVFFSLGTWRLGRSFLAGWHDRRGQIIEASKQWTGAIAVATIVVTLLVSHKVAGPLYRIEQDLREIGGGNLGLQVHLRQNDQLKELATRINEMVQGIQGKTLRVQEQVQEVLAQYVDLHLQDENPP